MLASVYIQSTLFRFVLPVHSAHVELYEKHMRREFSKVNTLLRMFTPAETSSFESSMAMRINLVKDS